MVLIDLESKIGAMGMGATESQFHVLAVDDSLIDRKLIEKLLKTSSYQVTTLDSGSKALEFLGFNEDDSSKPSAYPNYHQEVGVNLVITDYCMPGMTGYDLLRKIKESSSLRNIPVVIMSSENVPSRINRCLEEGAEEFFLKPMRLADVNKLRTHMMKTKCKNHQELEQQEKQEQTASEIPEVQLEEQEPSPQPLSQQQHPNNNKRKAMEEGLSPDRRRPIYSGLAVV